MQINPIFLCEQNTNMRKQNNLSHPKFTSAFVTLAEKNLGRHIANEVVESFNATFLPVLSKSNHLKEFVELAKKSDFWILGAGSGSRFKPLAKAFTQQTGIEANKISLPFPLVNGSSVHMLDWAMSIGVPFAKAEGKIIPKIAEKPSGSFGDIVRYYQENPYSIKDVIVCCGDNVFGTKKGELLGFIKRVINDDKLSLGLVGVKRQPEIAANRYGILDVGNRLANHDDVLYLNGFAEKPPIEIAKTMVTKDGFCVANTGMFVIKKPAMENLMNELKYKPNLIMKNEEEPYDFANAVKWVQQTYGPKQSVTKVIEKWEDVGEPNALYNFMSELKNGSFLDEFGVLKKNIQESFKNRFKFDGQEGQLLLSKKYHKLEDVPQEIIKNSPIIDGVNIIA